jgi:drug/metabolite transporter (DMT)-like permease
MGIIAALVSALCSAFKDVISKKLSAQVDGTVSTFASFIYALPYYAIVLVLFWAIGLEDFSMAKGFFFWIVLRASSDACAEWCKMQSFHYGDLSVVTSLFSLYPIMLLFTSPLITGDPITLNAISSVVITILGTLIILYQPRGSKDSINPKGVLFALGAAFFFSLNTCFDRLAVQTASPLLSGFVMTLLSGIFILPVLLRQPATIPQLTRHTKPFLQRGFLEISFMVIKLYALRVLQAPYVVGIQRIGVLISVINGRVLFQEGHFVRRMIGALLIIIGVLTLIFQI